MEEIDPTYPWQVVCVKWGDRYGPEFVNRLWAMVDRHTSRPVRFLCLTDDRTGVRAEVECHDLPPLPCEHPKATPGKWRKLVLWSRELAGVEGPLLFIDLDSVIVGSLDEYFTHGDPHRVFLARNWLRPFSRLGQTSVFRLFVGENPQVLDDFCSDPQGTADRYGFEQHYVTNTVRGGVEFWPWRWTRHFRLHCLPPFPLQYLFAPRLPRGAKIVTFPGGPDPGFVAEGRWSAKSPPREGRWAHIRAAFGPGRTQNTIWRHLKRYVRPSAWVAESWRE